MKTNRIPLFVYVAIALVTVLSAYSIWKRYEVESENRSVALAAEYETVEALAGAQGVPIEKALWDAKAQDLDALVLSEETIGELIGQGKAMLVSVPGPSGNPVGTAIRFIDPSSAPRVKMGLEIRFGGLSNNLETRGDTMILPSVSPDLIRSTAIGLNPGQVVAAKAAGMQIIARCSNPSGASSDAVRATLTWAHQLGATIFLPQGDEVLGRQEALTTTVDTLRGFERPMLYASPEFAKIAGDTDMVENAPDVVVRLHTAQVNELEKLSPVEAVDRFVKAARERNMRVLLLRPLSQSAPAPLASFNEFVKSVSQDLTKQQLMIGAPHAYREPGLPGVFFPILGLAISPAVWWTVARFVTSQKWRTGGGVALGLLSVACWTRPGHEGLGLHAREAMALLGSMAFPILGYWAMEEFLPRLKLSELGRAFAGFWIVSAVSLVGGLAVAGLLNGLDFYVKAAEFEAVKLSVFLPIVAIGIYYFIQLSNWKDTLKSPMTWGSSALGLCIGLVLALMWTRTGNDSGVGPSGGEMLFRNLLDRFLYVRPRTKELLVGHPLLVVGIGLLMRTWKRPEGGTAANTSGAGWTVLALMLGAIGQTSVVNTMCHLHIPVLLSLARVAEGLVLGSIIGIGLWAVVNRFVPGKEA